MIFTEESMESAQEVFDVIVQGQPKRALALEPVIRWPTTAWFAFTDTMRLAGFDFHNPDHLAALQSLIDKACDA
jgi:hypothetical protein